MMRRKTCAARRQQQPFEGEHRPDYRGRPGLNVSTRLSSSIAARRRASLFIWHAAEPRSKNGAPLERQPLPFGAKPALIGMVHLDALPGSPSFDGDLDSVVRHATQDALAIERGGFDGVLVENFNDVPFWKTALPPETIAALTRCALAVRQAIPTLPLGINALRNDGLAALGIAVAVGAQFIRINVLTGAMLTDQGIIEGCAAELLRRRDALRSTAAILADIQVKHAAALAPYPLEQSARDLVYRGCADAIVVSGRGTGEPTSVEHLEAVRRAVAGIPVVVGSGTTVSDLHRRVADAYIIGTAIKDNAGRVDEQRVRSLKQAAQLES